MNLKTFVSEALIEIDQALEDASKKFTKYNYKYWKNIGWNPTIDFEIQVHASEWTWIDWWAWITVAWVKIWANWERTTSNYEQSKICFSVVRENSPQQDKIERDDRMNHLPKATTFEIDDNPYS